MKKFTSAVVTLLTLGLVSASSFAAEKVVKIGTVLPLSGPIATFGDNTLKGIQLAVDEYNKNGITIGKDKYKINLVTADSKGDSAESANAVSKLIVSDKVVAVIGDVASSNTLASAPIAQSMGIPMISSASSNVKVTQIGDCIYRSCFTDPFQGRVMANFAWKNLKVKKVATFTAISSDYSRGLTDVFTTNFKKLGGTIADVESYSEGDQDFKAQLTKIKAKGVQAIYCPGYYTEVALIARQAKDLGLNIPLLGGDGFGSPKLYEIGGDAIVGSYFSTHYSPQSTSKAAKDFLAGYQKKYKDNSPDPLAALGYDAAKVVAEAIIKAKSVDSKAIKNAMKDVKIAGATGNIAFDSDRNPVKSAVILKVEKGIDKYSFVANVEP